VGVLIWICGWRRVRDCRGVGGCRRRGARLIGSLGGAGCGCLMGKGDGEGDDEGGDEGHEKRGSYDNAASRQI